MIRLVLLAAALILSAPVAAPLPAGAEEDLRCAGCDAAIEGAYTRFATPEGDAAFCGGCRENLPPCRLCRLPVRGGERGAAGAVCAHCAERWAAIPACSWCGERLVDGGTSLPELNLSVCRACRRERTPCAMCKLPLGLPGDDATTCSRCLARVEAAPRCSVCDEKLLGAHMVYTAGDGGKTRVCRDCARAAKACALCGVPAKVFERLQGKDVCPGCAASLPRCRGCGAAMRTRTIFTLSEHAYCPDCVRREPPCDSCGAPAGSGASLPDGRSVCADCRKDAVGDERQVRAMLEEIRGVMERSLGLKVREIAGVRFADRQEITRLFAAGGGGKERRMEEYPAGLFERAGERFNIYVLPHMRRDVLRGVLAHEFAHALLNEHYPSVASVEENEGFCEWVRYRFMKAGGDERGVAALMARDDLYGKAFRSFLATEKEGGVAAVFDRIGKDEPGTVNPKRPRGERK